MSAGMFGDDSDVMSEINMTPLVDVMLVLLIIFMITVPAMQHTVSLELPHASSKPQDIRPPHIIVDILSDGKLRWDNQNTPLSQFPEKVATAARRHPQPELHIYAERTTMYEKVAQIMAIAQSGGLTKIGLITSPESGARGE